MKSNFNQRRQQKAEIYKRLAEINEKKANQKFEAATKISSFIPFGQPILIGHHSENRHRRDLNKIDNNMRKGFEHEEKAKYYDNKAANAQDESKIFSDDPLAIQKLKEKIQLLERSHERMKEINKHFRKYGHVCGLNLDDETKKAIEHNLKFGFAAKTPFPPYSIQNSNTNIRLNKERLKQLEKASKEQTSEKVINNVRIVDNVQDNRLQIFFPDKPKEQVREILKHNGFRWSPTFGAWQRHRSSLANYKAEQIVKSFS
jgi:hypothetical protein